MIILESTAIPPLQSNKNRFNSISYLDKRQGESGRSLTEMLGVLAIMGIIVLTGVKMFHSAMNRHQANELIYEAQKRATSVAAQIMAGKDKNDLSVADFSDPEGYTFGVEQNPANPEQFYITINSVPNDICAPMQAMVGPDTVIRKIDTTCTEITFNDDLSKTPYASDNETEDACQEQGYTWCTKGNNGVGAKCSETTDCCVGISYDSQCQSCDPATGVISNKSTSTPCDFDGDHINDSRCSSGVCVDPNVTNGASCTTNADCGGVGSRYYCKINYNATNNLNTDPDTKDTECYHDLRGTCQVISGIVRLTTEQKVILTKAGFLNTFITGPQENWWSAKNWCEAQGKHLLNVEEMECYNGTSHNLVQAGQADSNCCKNGQTCQGFWSNLWSGSTIITDKETEVAKYSDKIVALRKVYGTDEDWFWLASPAGNTSQNSCSAFRTYLSRGSVAGYTRQAINGGYKFFSMCQ